MNVGSLLCSLILSAVGAHTHFVALEKQWCCCFNNFLCGCCTKFSCRFTP